MKEKYTKFLINLCLQLVQNISQSILDLISINGETMKNLTFSALRH